MKKIFSVLMAVVCIFVFGGCANSAKIETEKESDISMFVEIEDGLMYKVFYHKETKVMYVMSDGSYNHGTFTLLVNADGTPLLYKGGGEG